MHILCIYNGEYGRRHIANIQQHQPGNWVIETWEAPKVFPPVIDYPEDFLPPSLPSADLILSFAEHRGIAELLPDIAKMTGAKAVLVAVDDVAWLPIGLARQLHGWLANQGVNCATPKPLCSLTGTDYGVSNRERATYDDPYIREFALYFGQPDLRLTLDPDTRTITGVDVMRDAACGCARFVAEGLVGLSADDAEEKAGLLHHHFPCLASMVKLPEFNHDTLMHVSGHVIRNQVGDQVKPYKSTRYFRPGNLAE